MKKLAVCPLLFRIFDQSNEAYSKMAVNVEKTTVNPLDLKDCPVDTSLGTDDPNNVFTCKTWEKCCTVALEPACCADPEMSDAM